ncbi:MAG: Rieske (2Fe-2S) protein, partial [Kineosporiaceae bacterium]
MSATTAGAVDAPAGARREQPAPGIPRSHTVGRADEVPPGEGRAFTAGTVPVAVFRLRDGSLRATQTTCPHAGGPLADGQLDADVLVCPLHLYAFRWCDGGSNGGDLRVRTYPVREVDG